MKSRVVYVFEVIEEKEGYRVRVNDGWYSPLCESEYQAIRTGYLTFSEAQKTAPNNKYTAPQATPKSCTGCKYEPEAECTAECSRHQYGDMFKRA